MKICNIHIKGYQQFNNLFLDFTNPINGEPVKKVCLIGRNGTGKSTLLNFLNGFLPIMSKLNYRSLPFLLMKLKLKNQYVYLFCSSYYVKNLIFNTDIESEENWFEKLSNEKDTNTIREKLSNYNSYQIIGEELKDIVKELQFRDNSSDLLIFSPAESQQNSYLQVGDVPQTSLDKALKLFSLFPFHHNVSDQNVTDFWKVLIFLMKKRDNEREIFENKEENLDRTKKDLIESFEKDNPKILNNLADLWNKILSNAGLEFDVENASNPIQLNDNLTAYIQLKSTKQRINYNQLSTGIRNFIFRVGHIYSLYFSREIKRGFLLLDEPGNSLFPDFLFELIDSYQNLLIDKNRENNTQFFVSTHNPIIAAQFEPFERIILEWDENGGVEAYKGIAPIGDDPNDILLKDFKLKNLMGKKGQEMWNTYLDLRKKLKKTEDEEAKKELISQINKIGTDYNF